MPAINRLFDLNEADAAIIEIPQSTVFTNDLLVSIDGSDVEGHGPGEHAGPLTANGSPTVFVAYIPVNRIGDPDTCGHPRATGSPNVFVGDGNPTTDLPPPSSIFFRPDSPQVSGQQPYTKLNQVLSNPDQFNKPENAQSGAKPNFAGTPDNTETIVDTEPPVVCEGGGLSVIPFLQQCLNEAKEGKWRETGQFGKSSNPNILSMWRNIGLGYSSDQVPWCAGFACFAMKQSGMKFIKEPGAARLANRASEYEGQQVPLNEMRPGDLVLWNSGHVNFCYTANGGKYTFVGGNQMPGNAATPPVRDPKNDGDVTVSWPSGWTAARGGIVKVVRIVC